MALSFEESKKIMAAQAATMSLRTMAVSTGSETESFTRDSKYTWYSEYSDEKMSHIDENKNIILDKSQINITQETRSQFVPFEMSRKYDGFDLTEATIFIRYDRADGAGKLVEAVNVTNSNSKIRFAWLIDQDATYIAGPLQFEIHAIGFNSKNESYTWKTKICKDMTVLQGLEDPNAMDGLTEQTWVEEIIEATVSRATEKIVSTEVEQYASVAEEWAGKAEEYKNDAEKAASTAASAATDAVNATLANYPTKDDLASAIESVDVTEQLSDYVKTETLEANYYNKDDIDQNVTNKLDNYATKEEVKIAIEEVDISDQIGELGTDSYGNPITTVVGYVDNKVGNINVSEQLKDYYKKSETYTRDEVNAAIKNIDLSNYATTESLEEVSKNTITNAEGILAVQNDITTIQSSLSALKGDNENLIVQYQEVGSTLYLYEKDENGDITIVDGDEQITVKEISSTIITGAGGGSSLTSTIKIKLSPDGKESFTVLYGNDTYLNYNLSTKKATETQDEQGNDVTVYEEAVIPGDITLTVYRDNVYLTHFTVQKTSSEVQKGSIDISDYVILDSHIYTIKANYIEQLGEEETIPVRSSADWAINAVNLGITSIPDSTWETTPKYGGEIFSYTPIGALEKTIYFKIDDGEPETYVTSLNGTALKYVIPQLTHGVHTLQVWCEANINGTVIPTEPYKYVLMFVEDGNNAPIIRIKAPITLEQYSSDYIYYNVFDPSNPIIDSVTIYDEDGVILSSKENITSAEQKLEFRPSVVKNKTIIVQYKEITESVEIEVTKFPYEINAVTDGLMVDFVPTGRTNSDVDYKIFKNNAYTVEKDAETGEEVQTEIPMTWEFSKNFDWINGGWKTDASGDTYFCVKAGTYVDVNYNLFGTDGVVAQKDANGEYTIAGTGKEFKLIFKTTNVAQANATWLQCVDVADKKSLGIRMEAQNAYIDSSLGTLEIPYVDDDIIEFDMNIVPVTKFLDDGQPNFSVKAIPMIMTYEDGTPVQPKVISSVYTNFKQDTPQPITIGSEYCDVHIYRMKIYERYLEDKEIITNFIADARSGTDMAKRYLKNDIYPIINKQKITPKSVAAACPDLKVYVLSAPYFTNDKDDKVAGTTIQQIHNTGTREKPEYDVNENWVATDAIHNGQGTSSNEYGYSGRNLEFNMKKATITLGDNQTVVKKIQLSPTSYPTNYLNFKINIASSENANNALLQKRYDRYLPYTSVASLIDDRKKNSMEFFNCVVFIQETNEDTSTHREFSDTDIHFYGIGNIGDSKKTDDTRVNDPDDANEFCVEIMDWNRALSSFPADTMVSTATFYINEDEEKVFTYGDFLVDSNLGEDGILFEKDDQGSYYHSMDTTIDEDKTYYIDILENDDFSEDYTYGFRYIQSEWKEDDDPNYKTLNEEFQAPLRQKWIDFYRFVTRDLTTDGEDDDQKVADWKSEFSNWFITDAALYYYLYTLRYTMVDNRAKNTFWHWGKYYLTFEEAKEKGIAMYDEDKNLITDASSLPSKFYDANGNEIKNINATAAAINNGYRMDFWDYDNDTALGIDNAGKLEIPIGVEENDTDFAGVPYFRAHDSLVFTRIAKYFDKELENMWHNTEINPIGKVFDSTSFINEFDTWQDEFPEELWRLDYERKYKRTYVGGTGEDWDYALPQSNKSDIVSTRFLTEMMNGRKKYQRRCFERNQEIYMSSKFKGEVNLGDTITLRGTGSPTNKVVEPNFTLTIIPFSKMYVNLYNSTTNAYCHTKCEAGEPVGPISYPGTALDFIYVRGASQIQSLGDLSPMYLQTAELNAGAKLKTITLGNATTGYVNDSLKTLQIGAGNKLLEELDIRNLSNLNDTTLPVSNIPSLKRVYAQGSNISEAVFANNGLLEEAYLPATITRLELRNLHYLQTISLESYDNLLHLVVMNCSDVMNDLVLDMINQSPDLTTLRVTNIDWNLADTTILDRLYNLIKTPGSPEIVLTGSVYVPAIKEWQLNNYQNSWPNLEINYPSGGFTPTFTVTFINEDGTVLDVQQIDAGGIAVNPLTRENNPIAIPTKESSVSTDYTFDKWYNTETGGDWNPNADNIWKPTVIKATYTGTTRVYTVQFMSQGIALGDPIEAEYGSVVTYDGDTPTYDAQENSRIYYLFRGWDQFGYVDGDKIINAVFDSISFAATSASDYFSSKELSEMSPIEFYAMTRLKNAGINFNISDCVDLADTKSITLGYDVSYPDLKEQGLEQVLISDSVCVIEGDYNGASAVFGNNNYIDTGIQLCNEDRDFVLAIDYSISSSNSTGSTLVDCCDSDTSSGFTLVYNNGVNLNWIDKAATPSLADNREIMILRHVKGDNFIHVYSSNVNGENVTYVPLEGIHSMVNDHTLVFGCKKTNGGSYINNAIGSIYWSKVWYVDLGDEVCRKLASWPRETIDFELCGFGMYSLAEGGQECSMTFLASDPLSRAMKLNDNTTGGWASASLNTYLNNRIYAAFPEQWKQLIKLVNVKSSIGNKSTECTLSSCHIFIPCAYELNSSNEVFQKIPYTNEVTDYSRITYFGSDNNVRKLYDDEGNVVSYWTRSPNVSYTSYQYIVNANGELYGYRYPYENYYVRIMFSI